MATDSKTQAKYLKMYKRQEEWMCKHPGCKLRFYNCLEKNGLKHNKGVFPLRLLTNSFRGQFIRDLQDLKTKYKRLCVELMFKMAKHNKKQQTQDN